MRTKRKATDPKEQSQWEYKEQIVATYHCELPKMTALMTAALRRQLWLMKFLLLLQKKANIFLKDDNGDTALTYAVIGGNIEIIKLFLSKGLNINGTGGGGWSPLMTAVNDAYSGKSFLNGKDEVIQFLINNKASINYQDESGYTALMLAVDGEGDCYGETAITSDLEIIKLLIKNGANVNLKNNEGCTALDKAVSYENQSVIDYLVANGAKGKK
jgi:ankyrin repeat protein